MDDDILGTRGQRECVRPGNAPCITVEFYTDSLRHTTLLLYAYLSCSLNRATRSNSLMMPKNQDGDFFFPGNKICLVDLGGDYYYSKVGCLEKMRAIFSKILKNFLVVLKIIVVIFKMK